jgi:predicted dehydrogenase
LPSEAAIDGPLVDKRPFKFGLIGCGSQALLNLLPAALRIAGVKITAVCDILPARAQAAQKLAGGQAKIYDDWKALLKEADMDGVIIATPLVFHRPMAEEAFKNGRHVFCEKTMAYSIDDCKAMLRAQMASGRILQIGHHLRYHPLYYFANLHYIINHPLLGKISNVHCQWNRNGTWRRPAEPMAGVDFKKWGYDDADHVINWRLYRKYSGGLMTELASHQLDVVNWFLGDQLPQTVVGVGKTDNKDGRTIFDNVHLIYEYPDGVVMTYESITTNAFSPFGEAYEMFQGEKGTLVMAHLSRYVGLFFIEPGVAEELWMPAAHRAPLESPNLTQPVYKNPIVLNGTPSPGSRIEKVANLVDVINVVNIPQAQATMSTYEIELRGFKRAVLDKVRPYCDGMVGLKSAIPALLGLEAMEKNQRVVMNPSYLDLSATAGTTATTATAATATTSTKAGP